MSLLDKISFPSGKTAMTYSLGTAVGLRAAEFAIDKTLTAVETVLLPYANPYTGAAIVAGAGIYATCKIVRHIKRRNAISREEALRKTLHNTIERKPLLLLEYNIEKVDKDPKVTSVANIKEVGIQKPKATATTRTLRPRMNGKVKKGNP